MFELITSNAFEKIKEKSFWKPLGLSALYYVIATLVNTIILYSVLSSVEQGKLGALYYSAYGMSLLVNSVIAYYVMFYYLKYSRSDNDLHMPTRPTQYLKMLGLYLLLSVKLLLWTLLFVIPGIYKAYEYSMVLFIFIEDPDKDFKSIFEESKEMMDGHKLDLLALSMLLGFIFIIPVVVWSLLISPIFENALINTTSLLSYYSTYFFGSLVVLLPSIIFFAFINVCQAMFFNEVSGYNNKEKIETE